MKKAQFKCSYYGTGFDRNMIYMDFEYRGRIYTVYENRSKGNEPIAWQHKSAQARIDAEIESEEKRKEYEKTHEQRYEDTAEYGFDLFWKYVNSEIDEEEFASK